MVEDETGAHMNQYAVVVEYDAETKSYSVVCPELPGCASCGDSEEEAMANIKEAIDLYLAPDLPLEHA
jgi:predicted RNase H-like HicB family nuclease